LVNQLNIINFCFKSQGWVRLPGAPERRTWGDMKDTGHNRGPLMRKFVFLWTMLVVVALLGPVSQAQADAVGRLTLVEGRVDLLRGGQLPATPVKVDDGVQPGDVLRTKSLSKAQVTFIDNSTLAIAPESRVAIEAYMFDAAQNKRNAVLHLFQGLAHAVVSKVYKSAEPDFVIKTHTAIMGIRGTEFGIRLHPNSSTILNFTGLLQVGNILSEVSQLSRRAFKLAYSFGPGAGSGQHWVFLKDMQGTTVGLGLPPTQAFAISPGDWKAFMDQMAVGLTSRKSDGGTGGGGGGAVTVSETGGGFPATGGGPLWTHSVLGNQSPSGVIPGNLTTPVYTPPPVAPPPAVVTTPPPAVAPAPPMPPKPPKPPTISRPPTGPVIR
jgi:hypothetical protein